MKLYETINSENWAKGSYLRYEERAGQFQLVPGGCLMWHIDRALGLSVRPSSVEREPLTGPIHEAIMALFPDRSPHGTIPKFNDHADTTLEDVIRVLKVAGV